MTLVDRETLEYLSAVSVLGGLFGIATAPVFAHVNYPFIRQLSPFSRRVSLWPFVRGVDGDTDADVLRAMVRGKRFPFTLIVVLGLVAMTVSALQFLLADRLGTVESLFLPHVVFLVVGTGTGGFGLGLLRFAGRLAVRIVALANERPRREQIPLCSGFPVFLVGAERRPAALGVFYRVVGCAFIGMGAVMCASGYAIGR